jgi:retinol dehydrogenase 12
MRGQLRGKTALVTGGTDGIGKEVARGLARRGARIIIVGRNAEKGAQAEGEIRKSSDNSDVEFLQGDLSLIQQAHQLGKDVANRCPALNYLVHSAGIVRGRHVLTEEGFESNFATNYLSRFALTTSLLSALEAAGQGSDQARVLIIAHPGFDGSIEYDDINLKDNFSTMKAFRQFHYANDVFAVQLARRLATRGGRPPVTISCLHPGPTRTNIDREMPLWMKLLLRVVIHPLVSRKPEVPAAAALNLLLADEFEDNTGALYSMVGKFKRLAPPKSLHDASEGERLWGLSEALLRTALGQASSA